MAAKPKPCVQESWTAPTHQTQNHALSLYIYSSHGKAGAGLNSYPPSHLPPGNTNLQLHFPHHCYEVHMQFGILK